MAEGTERRDRKPRHQPRRMRLGQVVRQPDADRV